MSYRNGNRISGLKVRIQLPKRTIGSRRLLQSGLMACVLSRASVSINTARSSLSYRLVRPRRCYWKATAPRLTYAGVGLLVTRRLMGWPAGFARHNRRGAIEAALTRQAAGAVSCMPLFFVVLGLRNRCQGEVGIKAYVFGLLRRFQTGYTACTKMPVFYA